MSNAAEMTLPPEWDDDERMNFLFSEFKENRDVNTTDWDSKMDFWTALITKSCRERGSVLVNLQDLNKTFRRKEKSPLGLSTVLQSMARYLWFCQLCTAVCLSGYKVCVGPFVQMWEDPEGVRVCCQCGLRVGVLECGHAAGETTQVDLLHSSGKQPGSSGRVFCCS